MTKYRAYLDDSVTPSLQAPFFSEHLARYLFISQHVQNKNVLELGCGKGYGSFLLAQAARHVVACDLNADSIEFAKQNYASSRIDFIKESVFSPRFKQRKFECLVCLEVLEHLPPEETDHFLAGLKDLLAPNGVLFLSTPNHNVVVKSGMPVPEFHINNLGTEELESKLSKHFSEIQILGQIPGSHWLTRLVYTLDQLNLRHSPLIKSIRALGKRSLELSKHKTNISEEPLPTWTIEQGFGEAPNFRFSSLWRRSAGMLMAVCRI